MRLDVQLELIEALKFYARPKNHEIRDEACPVTGQPAAKPSRMFMDKGEMARQALAKLGIVEG